jgi:cytoskeletal protein RodZ
VSIGDTLAEARRQAGLTLTQVSQQTRIRESIIRSIEQDDFSPCGGDFYARGHIRSIAAVVGVDPVPLIREYDDQHGKPGNMRAAQIFEPATPIKIREPRQLHLGRVLVVALLAVIGFGAYHIVSTRNSHSSATATATVRPVATAAPKATVKPKAHPAGPVYPKGSAVIAMTVTDPSGCWVGVTSIGGTQKAHTYPGGATKTWTETKPLTMIFGNPSGIKLTVNGKTEKMNPNQVAQLTIDPKNQNPVTIG